MSYWVLLIYQDLTNALNLKLDITTFEAQLTQLQTAIRSQTDKLVAGNNITIDENTNVISASGDYYKKSETYSKTEIDTMIGDIDSILDSILGV